MPEGFDAEDLLPPEDSIPTADVDAQQDGGAVGGSGNAAAVAAESAGQDGDLNMAEQPGAFGSVPASDVDVGAARGITAAGAPPGAAGTVTADEEAAREELEEGQVPPEEPPVAVAKEQQTNQQHQQQEQNQNQNLQQQNQQQQDQQQQQQNQQNQQLIAHPASGPSEAPALARLLLTQPKGHVSAVLDSLLADAHEAAQCFLGSMPQIVRLAVEAEVRQADWRTLAAAQVRGRWTNVFWGGAKHLDWRKLSARGMWTQGRGGGARSTSRSASWAPFLCLARSRS